MKTISFLFLVYFGKLFVYFVLNVWLFLTKNRYGTKKYLKILKENLFFKDLIALSIVSLT